MKEIVRTILEVRCENLYVIVKITEEGNVRSGWMLVRQNVDEEYVRTYSIRQ